MKEKTDSTSVETRNPVQLVMDELRAQGDKLSTLYWAKHQELSTKGYSSSEAQIKDAVALGKIAEAQIAIREAVAALYGAR